MWRLLACIFVTSLLVASAAHAETYKWVDQNGVTNYSNTPPPASAKATQGIGERVSTIQSDPSLKGVAYQGLSPYETMLQQEWLQRQRLMAESENIDRIYGAAPVDPYYYRTGYYYPVSTVRPIRPVRPVRPVRPAGGVVRVSHHQR